MSYTPFQAPVLGGLLGDDEIAAQFSVKAELAAMLRFETALARACANSGLIPADAAAALAEAATGFEPDLAAIRQATARDGVAVPELVRQLRARLPDQDSQHLHFGATSQDVIDTALVLRLAECRPVFQRRVASILSALDGLERRFGDRPLMARTRMQAALETTVAHRIGQWRMGVADANTRLAEGFDRAIRLQFGGAVGDFRAFGQKAAEVASALAKALDLPAPEPSWHTQRGGLVQFVSALSGLAASLGKIGADLSLMAQNELDEAAFAAAGGSSAMPHKQNPVLAEALVTLARFNAMLAGGMHQAGLHEQERSGAAWTLEWMILPQACVAAGAATRNCFELLQSVERLGKA